MSQLIYNGIELKLLKTNLIARDNIWSPDGADLLYQKWTFDVDCVFNPGATSYAPGSPGDADEGTGDAPPAPVATKGILPALTDVAIRERLMEPRRQLTFAVPGAGMLLSSPQPSASVDALDGPKPLSCYVKRIDSCKTFLISFRIETHVSECSTAADAAADPLLSNRYEVVHSVDDQRMTVLTYSGAAAFRMDALGLTATGNADAFRARCLPPIPLGFQRQSVTVKVNSVGNMLLWSCVDAEMFYSLGSYNRGVEKFEATYTQSTTPAENTGFPSLHDAASLDIRAWGSRATNMLDLHIFCLAVAVERLGIKAKPARDADAMIKQVQVAELVHDRIVDLRIVVQLPPTKQGFAGLPAIGAARLGVDLLRSLANNGQNPQMPNDSNTRGTYTAQAFAAALQAACTRIEPVKASPGQTVGYSTYPLQNVDVSVDSPGRPTVPTSSTRYSYATTAGGIYTDYRVEAKWKHKTGKKMVPVAGPIATTKPAFPQVFAPCTEITYDWTCERNGSIPAMPTTEHNDQRMILLENELKVCEKVLAPDGLTPVYRTQGRYTYGYNAAFSDGLPVSWPTVPYTDFTYGEDPLANTMFVHGIIDGPYPSNADSSTGGGSGGSADSSAGDTGGFYPGPPEPGAPASGDSPGNGPTTPTLPGVPGSGDDPGSGTYTPPDGGGAPPESGGGGGGTPTSDPPGTYYPPPGYPGL